MFELFLQEYGMQILYTIVIAVFGYIGMQAKALYEQYVNTKEKQAVAETVCKAVEQIYKDLSGEEKKQMALQNIEAMLNEKGISYREVIRLEDVLPQLDLLYMTRVQRERFFNEEDYIRLKDFYILTKEKMALAPDDMLVLHPLPRVNEISVEIDDDPRAVYFKQAQYGVYVRMALILTLLQSANNKEDLSC